MYESTLIIGATNVPNVLDITQVQPGTLIVDDSGPHCFDSELAIQRLQQQEDILFTEGGVLQLPHPITQLAKRQLEKLKIPGRTGHPFNITGCVLSSLLTTTFSKINPTVGLVETSDCLQHYNLLKQLAIRAADLHCEEVVLPKEAIRNFRERYGQPRCGCPN